MKFAREKEKIAEETITELREKLQIEKVPKGNFRKFFAYFLLFKEELAKKSLIVINLEQKTIGLKTERENLLNQAKVLHEKIEEKSLRIFEMEHFALNHYENKIRERDQMIEDLCQRCVDVETSVRSFHIEIEQKQATTIGELEMKIKSLEDEKTSLMNKSAALEYKIRSLNTSWNQNSSIFPERIGLDREDICSTIVEEKRNLSQELEETKKYCEELKNKLNNFIMNGAASLNSELLIITDDLLSDVKQTKEHLEILLTTVCQMTKRECKEEEKYKFRNFSVVDMITFLKKIIDDFLVSNVDSAAPMAKKRQTRQNSRASSMTASDTSVEYIVSKKLYKIVSEKGNFCSLSNRSYIHDD